MQELDWDSASQWYAQTAQRCASGAVYCSWGIDVLIGEVGGL